MLKKISLLILLFIIFSSNILAETIVLHEQPTAEQIEASRLALQHRYLTDAYITKAEIKRAHEIKVEEKKIEVLARLKQFQASNVYSSSRSGSITELSTNQSTQITQTSTQTNNN